MNVKQAQVRLYSRAHLWWNKKGGYNCQEYASSVDSRALRSDLVEKTYTQLRRNALVECNKIHI